MTHAAVPAPLHPVRPLPSARVRLAQRGQPAIRRRAAEHERQRLARDLHDGPIQEVLAAGLAIDVCLAELPAGSPVRAKLEHARRLTGTALRRLRSSLETLREPAEAEDEELPAMLRRLTGGRPAQQLDVSLEMTGAPVPLEPEVRRSLSRAASECVFNAAVHAQARRVVIRLSYGPGVVGLCVADDGSGMPETISKIIRGEVPGTGGGYHYGLADVAAQARELGWMMRADRSDLGGIAVRLLAPMNALVTPAPALAAVPGPRQGERDG